MICELSSRRGDFFGDGQRAEGGHFRAWRGQGLRERSSGSTGVELGKHWDEIIRTMLTEGRYGSASELMHAGLRLLEGDAGPLDMVAVRRAACARLND